MSFSVPGGFTGGDALLALATIQQGRWNEQMTDGMRLADLRSQMASDINDIKAHLEQANRNPTRYGELDGELQAFLEKYGQVPELEEPVSAVKEIADSVHSQLQAVEQGKIDNGNGNSKALADWTANGKVGPAPKPEPDPTMQAYDEKQISGWLDQLTGKLDASGTSDQLGMIYIKQLNDNINNNSGLVSGIIESRNNATASIINNIA